MFSGGPIYATSYAGPGNSSAMNISGLSDDGSFLHFNNHGPSGPSGHAGAHADGGSDLFTKTGRPRKLKEPKGSAGGAGGNGKKGGLSGSFMEDEEDGAMGTQLDDSVGK